MSETHDGRVITRTSGIGRCAAQDSTTSSKMSDEADVVRGAGGFSAEAVKLQMLQCVADARWCSPFWMSPSRQFRDTCQPRQPISSFHDISSLTHNFALSRRGHLSADGAFGNVHSD